MLYIFVNTFNNDLATFLLNEKGTIEVLNMKLLSNKFTNFYNIDVRCVNVFNCPLKLVNAHFIRSFVFPS